MNSVCINIHSTSFESSKGGFFGVSNITEGTKAYVRGLTVGMDLIHGVAEYEHLFNSKKDENKRTRKILSATNNFIGHVKVDNYLSELSNGNLFAKLLNDRQFFVFGKSSLISKLEGLGALPNGWLGPDSVAPNVEAIKEAKNILISVIEKYSLAEPKIRAVADGEVNFYWNTDGYLIDMAFFGEGEYSYYYKNKLNGEEEYDDVSIDKGFSDKMLQLLSW